MRTAWLALGGLTLCLVLFPLVLVKPGWPAGLKADEPAYFLMAESLAHDHDLRTDTGDLRRLFDSFPYAPTHNLILMTDDGWRDVYFGKPYLYSLFAVPWVWLAGASGMVAFNMALLLAMVWMGAAYLRRYNSDGLAVLYATGFFLLSAGFPYVFWLHPEVFNMAAVMASLWLVLGREPFVGAPAAARDADGATPDATPAPGRGLAIEAALSGAALAFAVTNKPMLALLGIPLLWVYARARRWGAAAIWIAGALVTTLAVAGISYGLTGHPSSYFGVTRGGFTVCSPDVMPVAPLPDEAAPAAAAPAAAAAAATPPSAGPAAGAATTATAAPAAAVTASSAPAPAVPAASAPPAPGPAGVKAAEQAAAVARAQARRKGAASWSWIFRVPDVRPRELAEALGYFLWGRHTGLFLYQPFALLSLLLFVVFGWRSGTRWILLGSLAAVALVFVLFIPENWHGGGGFFGNRYFVYCYPGFLFLVTRIAPAAVTLVGYALGGILLGPSLFTPLGRAVPWPTLQAHVRNFPFRFFPLELSLKGVPGYTDVTFAGVRFRGREDSVLPRGDRLWLQGASNVELWLESASELPEIELQLASPAAPNDVEVRLDDLAETRHWDARQAGGIQPVTLRPPAPSRVRFIQGRPLYVYHLVVRSRTGVVRPWIQEQAPRECFTYPGQPTSEEVFYTGVELGYRGDAARLALPLYAVGWGGATAPAQVRPGDSFAAHVRLRNRSAVTWPADLPTRVQLSYHWLDPAGTPVEWDGVRTPLGRPIAPNEEVEVDVAVRAPEQPGAYLLAFDPVYEQVAWFSSKNGGDVLKLPVEVVAPQAPDDVPPAPKASAPDATPK